MPRGAPGIRLVGALVVLAALALLVPTDYPPRRLTYPITRPAATEIARAFLRELGVDPAGNRAVSWSTAGFPRFLSDARRPEVNLPPERDDGLARAYVAEVGGLEAWRRVADGLLPAAGWTTRLIRRDGGDEWFVTVNPRSRSVVAFWRERGPKRGDANPAGSAPPRLATRTPRDAIADSTSRRLVARLIARLGPPGDWSPLPADSTSAGYPGERTLLFSDRSHAVGDAVPVLTVILRDGAPAGYGVALRLPADWVAKKTLATPLSSFVSLLRLALLAGLGGLGLLEVRRRLAGRGAEVRAALRIALVLSLPILLYHLNRSPSLLVRYPTSVPWSVFVASSAVGLGLSVALQALLIFLSLLALAAARPDWRMELPPRGWRPVARPALAVVITALALGIIVDRLELLGRLRWPSLFPGPTPPSLPGYGAIYPFFDVAWTAVTGSAFVGGLIALVTVLTQGPLRRRSARVAVLTLIAVGLGPDRARTLAEAVVPTLYEVLALLTAIVLARRMARGLLPAYVAFLPLALGGQNALLLVRQPEIHARLSGVLAFGLLGVPLILLAATVLQAPRTSRSCDA